MAYCSRAPPLDNQGTSTGYNLPQGFFPSSTESLRYIIIHSIIQTLARACHSITKSKYCPEAKVVPGQKAAGSDRHPVPAVEHDPRAQSQPVTLEVRIWPPDICHVFPRLLCSHSPRPSKLYRPMKVKKARTLAQSL